ncbi:MAG: Gx transporter family protein [Oscillospiraceae bacterium]|jgi:heptaprenyl diphosphate synthase|nr:Gx transporter family protein [Oscillospiraceae bacterium]
MMRDENNRIPARLTAVCALFAAAAAILSIAESAVPPLLPVPGAKLGLANAVTVFCLYRFPKARWVAAILSVRILLGGLYTGPFPMLYSAVGGFAAFFTELLLKRAVQSDTKLIFLVSAVGGAAHNAVSLAFAAAIARSTALFYYLPWLLAIGIVSGAAIGLLAEVVLRKLPSSKET